MTTGHTSTTISERHGRVARRAMILVGGPPGSGKSTVAAGLGDALGCTVLRSDEVRREVLGGESWACLSEWLSDRFSTSATDATYAEMIRRAGELLRRGRTVVLDATWTSAAHREHAEQIARACRSTLVALRCNTPPAVAERRVARRIAAGSDISMATVDVARRIAAHFAPWPAAVAVDAASPAGDTVGQALAVIRRRLDGPLPADAEDFAS